MDMVERVSRALADTTDFDGDRMASRYAESELRDMAKAAIRAMLEGLEPVAWRYVGKDEDGDYDIAAVGHYERWTQGAVNEYQATETPLYDLSAIKEAIQ